MSDKVLTVLIPITENDVKPVDNLPVEYIGNINTIYKHGGVYKRLVKDKEDGHLEYVVVTEREFPFLGRPMEITNFTYDAVRMGQAPTLSAQGVMWEADKDEYNNDITLDDLWTYECHVKFNGENLYLKKIPTSSKDNEDSRYKYDLDFVSERVVLENVYFYDIVRWPYTSDRSVSEKSEFSFYGDISVFSQRLNSNFLHSGLASLVRKYVRRDMTIEGITVSVEVPYLTYDEWVAIPNTEYPTGSFIPVIYTELSGDYNAYLLEYIYENDNGECTIKGYKCVIGTNKKGQTTTSEEKLIPVDDCTLHEALQFVHDIYELEYYIYSEKDSNGNFTGNTIVMIGDCQYDFANGRGSDGIPTSNSPIDYGINDELLFKEKANSTDKIITRITGHGSESNIPWYYPNPTADGWIKPVYMRGDSEVKGVVVYPEDEGSTVEDNAVYDRYLKNRLGKEFIYKKSIGGYYMPSDIPELEWYENTKRLNVIFTIQCNEAFHIEQVGVKNTFNNNTPTFTINGDGISAEEDVDTLSSPEFSAGTYRLITHFNFDSHPAPTEFGWYLITINKGVATEDYFIFSSIFVDASKFTKDEVLSFEREAVSSGGVMLNNNWYYRDRYGIRRLAWSMAASDWDEFENRGVIGPQYRRDFKTDTPCKVFDDLSGVDGGWDGKYYIIELGDGEIDSKTEVVYNENELYKLYIQGYLKICTKHWMLDGKEITDFSKYGLTLDYAEGESAEYGDLIKFQLVKYLTPQGTLMPDVYVKTDGERRFYPAVNYPKPDSTPDAAIGEIAGSGGSVINPLYYKEGTSAHYVFDNEILLNAPKEHIKNFEDIKPTIEGIVRYNPVTITSTQWNENPWIYYYLVDGVYHEYSIGDTYVSGRQYYTRFRIDIVEEFAYDEFDDDNEWESNDDGNTSGEYKHPYFFAKLRPLGFNIFDLALQEDMVISMTTGDCGACNFKIGVDENTKKNPVQVWEYDVYAGPNYANRGDIIYHAGDLRRKVDTTRLCYDTNGEQSGYVQVDKLWSKDLIVDLRREINAGEVIEKENIAYSRLYKPEDIVNGEVGSLKKSNKDGMEGDVITSGRFIESQQDTTSSYVWVALYKDTETYGTIMPSAKPDYSDGTLSHYIEPKGAHYYSRKDGEWYDLGDEADKFVILNIKLPQIYIREAEKKLSKELIKYMYENNAEKFNFNIKFSRIFLGHNPDISRNINENSVLYIRYDRRTYRQYVKHYTYKMSDGEPLPEISIDLNEELAVSRNSVQVQAVTIKNAVRESEKKTNKSINRNVSRIDRTTVSKSDDVVISGNLVSRSGATSLVALRKDSIIQSSSINRAGFDIRDSKKKITIQGEEINTQRNSFSSLVGAINTFNADVVSKMGQVRQTIEKRVLTEIPGSSYDSDCPDRKVWDVGTDKTYFWLQDGGSISIAPAMCVQYKGDIYNGMQDLNWTNFSVS